MLQKYCSIISINLEYLLNLYSINILDLSKEMDVSYATTYKLVNGLSNPTLETLLKVSSALKISVSQLIGELPLENNTNKVQVIPLISWDNITSFLNGNNNIIQCITISSKAYCSNKAFALLANAFVEQIFDSGTTLVFDVFKGDIKELHNKYTLISQESSNPTLKKIHIEEDKIYIQPGNNIPAYELLDHNRIVAKLVHLTIDS